MAKWEQWLSLNSKNAGALIRGARRSFAWPENVDGWLSRDEGEALYALALEARGLVVELGAYKGKSTICLAQGAQRVVTVDHLLGDPADSIPDGYGDELRANLRRYGVGEKVDVIVGDTAEAARLKGEPVSLLFIDGDHQHCQRDLLAWLPSLKAGAVVAFHDSAAGDVPQAIDTLRQQGWCERAAVGSLTVMERHA